MGLNPYWEATRRSATQFSKNVMEHESSLPRSQEPATSPYSEPAESIPYPHNLSLPIP
jgi:hypothetical protein